MHKGIQNAQIMSYYTTHMRGNISQELGQIRGYKHKTIHHNRHINSYYRFNDSFKPILLYISIKFMIGKYHYAK